MQILTLIKFYTTVTDRGRFQPCSKIKILVLLILLIKRVIFGTIFRDRPYGISAMLKNQDSCAILFKKRVIFGTISLLALRLFSQKCRLSILSFACSSGRLLLCAGLLRPVVLVVLVLVLVLVLAARLNV